MTRKQIEAIQRALDAASNPGDTKRDEELLGFIEGTLLGHDHGIWRWRCPQTKMNQWR
jgi:hypothetical protein